MTVTLRVFRSDPSVHGGHAVPAEPRLGTVTLNGAGHPGCVTVAPISSWPWVGARLTLAIEFLALSSGVRPVPGSGPQHVGTWYTPAEVCVGGSCRDRQVLTCAWEGGAGPSVTSGQAGQDTSSFSDSRVALRQPTARGLWVPTQVGVGPPESPP